MARTPRLNAEELSWPHIVSMPLEYMAINSLLQTTFPEYWNFFFQKWDIPTQWLFCTVLAKIMLSGGKLEFPLEYDFQSSQILQQACQDAEYLHFKGSLLNPCALLTCLQFHIFAITCRLNAVACMFLCVLTTLPFISSSLFC